MAKDNPNHDDKNSLPSGGDDAGSDRSDEKGKGREFLSS